MNSNATPGNAAVDIATESQPADDQVSSVSPEAANQILTVEEIQALLPHRYPFALVDRVLELVPGERVVALKNVTFNEPFFQGHFPGRSIMPGVLIIEAMAQAGGVLLARMPDIPPGLLLFAGIDKARFRRPVVPGDQLIMTVELLSIKRKRFGKTRARAEVAGQLAAEGELMFSLVD